MKNTKKMGRQGDVLFIRVNEVPSNAFEEPRNGPIVCAHSETGHHHVVRDPSARFFSTDNPLVCYLRCAGPVTVDHLREFHAHEPLLLEASDGESTVWEVRRQREHAPEGWRRVQD